MDKNESMTDCDDVASFRLSIPIVSHPWHHGIMPWHGALFRLFMIATHGLVGIDIGVGVDIDGIPHCEW